MLNIDHEDKLKRGPRTFCQSLSNYKQAIIGPQAKRHLNGLSLVYQ